MFTKTLKQLQPSFLTKSLRPFGSKGLVSMNTVCRFDEDQLMLQDMVRDFSKKRVAPLAEKIDREDWFPRELWPEMGELGLHGITTPEQYGGSGMNYTAQCIVTEELSRCSGSVGLSYVAHSNLCVNQITRNGSEAQK